MKKYYFILVSIVLLNCSSIKNNNAHLNDLIPEKKLKSDVDYTYSKMQKLHPRLNWYISQKDLDYKFDSLKSTINKPMTSFEFYKKISPIVSSVCEGHMIMIPPIKQYTKSETAALVKKGISPFSQFEFEIFNDKMYVVKNKSYDKKIKIGTEILAINGKKVPEYLSEYKNWFSSDGKNQTFKKNRLARSFNMFFTFQNGIKDSLKYEFKFNDSIKTVSILRKVVDTTGQNKKVAKVKLTDFEKAKNKSDQLIKKIYGYDATSKEFNRKLTFLEKDSAVAVIKIRSFSIGDSERCYEEMFSKIAYWKSKTLIIDLRNNPGGRLEEISNLYSYLSEKPFVFMDNAEVTKKSSLLHADYFKGGSFLSKVYRGLLSPIYYPYQYFKVKKDSNGKYFYNTENKLTQIKKDAFKGKIYVLINGGSFSASSIISSNLKGSKRAYFVGEETGGAFNGTVAGQMPIIKIPVSKLNLKLGLTACIPFHKTELEGRGIFPDKEILPTLEDRIKGNDPEMNWILEDLKIKNNDISQIK
jgi:C-terminal processing protease CtpA/Prc